MEEPALERAERECLADEDARHRRRLREEERRAEGDIEFHGALARAITELFPGCPLARAEAIARHASARHSGRVGRSAAGRALDPEASPLPWSPRSATWIRPTTGLLMSGASRADARRQVARRSAPWSMPGGEPSFGDAFAGSRSEP